MFIHANAKQSSTLGSLLIYSPWNISKQDLVSGTSPNSTWTSDAFRQRHGENCLALLQNKLLPHLLRYFRCCSRSFWCLRNRWPKHAAKPNQSEVVPPFLHACCVTFTTGLQTAFPRTSHHLNTFFIILHNLHRKKWTSRQPGALRIMRCFDPDFSATITSLKWIENANPPFSSWSRTQFPPVWLMFLSMELW